MRVSTMKASATRESIMVTTERTGLAALACALLGIAASTGCHHSPTEGGVRMEQVLAAFDKAGWKASALPLRDPGKLSAQKCVEGTLDGVEALICEYGGADAALRGKKAVEGWVASAVTGVALGNGRTVLGLADRSRKDPVGKSIHAISQTYLALQ
jgi:hypothetical protein